LMAAGANQQLVATQLETADTTSTIASDDGPQAPGDGMLEIDHAQDPENTPAAEPPTEPPQAPAPETPGEPASALSAGSKLVTEAPQLGGTLTANSQSERLDPVTD